MPNPTATATNRPGPLPAPANLPRQHRSSSGSKIIPVEKRDLFLTITMVFVIANVVPHMWANLTVLALLLVFTLIVLFHNLRPQSLPGILARSADDFTERVKENPWDLLTIFGIVALTMVKDFYLQHDDHAVWRELFSILLILLAIRLSRTRPYRIPSQAGPLHGLRVWWSRLLGHSPYKAPASSIAAAGPVQPVELESPPEAIPTPGTDPDKPREEDPVRDVWEERQRARWRDWIEEEVHRLDEDHKKRK